MTKKMVPVLVLALAMAMAPPLTAQVQTEVPPVVAGAKAVTVEHIKIHGEALEGNLEGDAVERERHPDGPRTIFRPISINSHSFQSHGGFPRSKPCVFRGIVA